MNTVTLFTSDCIFNCFKARRTQTIPLLKLPFPHLLVAQSLLAPGSEGVCIIPISYSLEAIGLLLQIQHSLMLVCCSKQCACHSNPPDPNVLNKVGCLCLDYGDLSETPRDFLKAKSSYVDKTQPMQGVVRHAKEENKIKTGDKRFGPHLTQQSAQVDHWALWENKASEAMLGSKFYFSCHFYTFIIIFIIDLYFLKSIVTQLTLISVFCKGNIPFFNQGYCKMSRELYL